MERWMCPISLKPSFRGEINDGAFHLCAIETMDSKNAEDQLPMETDDPHRRRTATTKLHSGGESVLLPHREAVPN